MTPPPDTLTRAAPTGPPATDRHPTAGPHTAETSVAETFVPETFVALPRHVDVTAVAPRLESAPAADIVAWGLDTFGDRICVTTSFADTVLVHLATSVHPDVDVIFCDTGFHFPETLATMRAAMVRYELNLTVPRPSAHADDLWAAGTNACCAARKVATLESAMEGRFDAWITGLRRADSSQRAETPVVERARNGRVKVNPLARWSDDDVAHYVATHDLVVNELSQQGYPSIGCWPCTEPASADDPRAGRWAGSNKTECGLHW